MRGVNIDRKIVEVEIKKGEGLVVYPNKTISGDYILT
jgi:KaiC/GvpD/RAD55 family RecA-like ATPase